MDGQTLTHASFFCFFAMTCDIKYCYDGELYLAYEYMKNQSQRRGSLAFLWRSGWVKLNTMEMFRN